jgi:quercetin dioxygenase-like cupin family protein
MSLRRLRPLYKRANVIHIFGLPLHCRAEHMTHSTARLWRTSTSNLRKTSNVVAYSAAWANEEAMANVITRSNRERPAHTTNGSSRRTARSVSAQGMIFRVASEIQSLKQDLPQTTGGRAAKTLAKSRNLRVALITLRSGSTIDPHAITGGATLYVLEGRLRIHTEDVAEEVETEDVVVLNQNLRKPVVALDDATVLAVVAWPDGAGAWDAEITGGRL